jgi:hypothetical protein
MDPGDSTGSPAGWTDPAANATIRNDLATGQSLPMNPVKITAIVLIIAGVLGLVYGGFSYTKDTTVVKLGPIEVFARERQTVNVPMWAGVGAIAIGGLLLVFGGKRQ